MEKKDKNSLNVSFFLKEILVRDVMAKVLDMARMSNMGDRQFEQFERSIKDTIYNLIRDGNDVLVSTEKLTTSPTNDVLPRVDKKSE